jgi:hypothetical protein
MAKKPAVKSKSKVASPPAPTARKRAVRRPVEGPTIPDRLYAQVSPHSIGGLSLFDYDGPIDPEVVSNFASDPDLLLRAAQALQDSGFEVLQISPYTINVAAPISTFERAFRNKIVPHELPVIKSHGPTTTATFFSGEESPRFGLLSTEGTAFENQIEGVAIEVPRYYHVVTPYPPNEPYWHLNVPAGVSMGCNADRPHRSGITGRGIMVAMVDSGHYAHPFFSTRGYRVQPVTLGPGAINAAADEVGHGTAESANIFAVAPDITLHPVKMNFANATGAFNAAVALNPAVITCSWGSDVRSSVLQPADQALAVAIADAVSRGIIVVFSAGNGSFGFPGQHPDVIAAGGVFRAADGSLQASDYASGFASPVYPGRNVPDVCGLVGMQPRGAYIMLPLEPGCQIDVDLATSGAWPNGDNTASDDGWSAISGTSAAAPQLAGVAALMKQACARLTPAEVRDIMKRTAIDVTIGHCNPNSSGATAGPGADLATGAGLVDANAAVLLAKIRCLGPIRPIKPPVTTIHPPPIRPPIQPPVRPPIQPPIRPPVQPVIPVTPVEPIRPSPVIPVRPPIRPIEPIGPIGPGPVEAAEAGVSTPQGSGESQLSAEDVAALEELVIRSKIDPLA